MDQALRLREMARQTRGEGSDTPPEAADPAAMQVVAVTSGKGGVGKTSFTINFALALREQGKRVAILDADLGMANVNVALGMAVRSTLQDVVSGERRLEEIAVEGPGGVLIVPGGSGVQSLADLDEAGQRRLVEGLGALAQRADVLLIDTAAGISRSVLAFACAADQVVVVTVPEPPAIADAYGMIKALLTRKRDARVRLVVNRTLRSFEGKAVQEKLDLVVRRFLNAEIQPLGTLPDDEAVPMCVRVQRPFFLHSPSCGAARAMRKVARDFLGEQNRSNGGAGGFLERLLGWFR